jgi:hypothetical protein
MSACNRRNTVHFTRGDGSPQLRPPIFPDALSLVIENCKPGAKIVDLCEKADAFITE